MARIRLLEVDEAPQEVRPIYEAQKSHEGKVLNTTKARAHRPELLQAITGMIRATETDALMPPDLRTLLNVRISQINGCLH